MQKNYFGTKKISKKNSNRFPIKLQKKIKAIKGNKNHDNHRNHETTARE